MHPDSQIIAQLTAINQFCTVEAKTGEIMVDLATKNFTRSYFKNASLWTDM